MDEAELPGTVEPDMWFVIFHPDVPGKWVKFFSFGRFKHVSAIGYCPGFKVWLICDPQWKGLRLSIMAHAAMLAAFPDLTRGREVVRVTVDRAAPMPLRTRLGFYCVPAIKHLLGVRCAIWRPDALYRHLIRNGGQPIDERHATNAGRPEPGDGTAASAERPR